VALNERRECEIEEREWLEAPDSDGKVRTNRQIIPFVWGLWLKD
jgi:hypothetical protein